LATAGAKENEDEEVNKFGDVEIGKIATSTISRIVTQMNCTAIVDKQDEYCHESYHGRAKIASP
jgi:hypothetical protein